MATTTVDIESLKHELKAWERKFKQEHRTDKISKEDMKAHPDIDAKYKLWRELSKSTVQPAAKKQQEKIKPAKAERAAQPPSTPRAPSRKSSEKALSSSNIFHKSVPTREVAIASTSNPFSPTKGKRRALEEDDDDDDEEHTIPARPETGKNKKMVAFESHPRFVAHTPVSTSAASASSSSSTEPPNPFAPSSPTKGRSSKRANLFVTPSKSARNKSFDVPDSPATSLHSSAKDTTRSSAADYAYADFPKKLKALISSALRDTPRTKSRKRLRGEDVNETPGDKRRRLTAGAASGSQQGRDDANDDDDEEMDFSPVKPAVGTRGKAFRPVFDDDADGVDVRGAAKPAFFGRTASGGGPAFSRALSRTSSLSTSTLRFSKTDAQAKDSQGSMFPAGSSRPGKATGTKRPSAELDDDDDLQTDDTIGDTQSSAANRFALRPPSPPPGGDSSRNKNKWGAGARKKGKVDVPMIDVEDASPDDDDDEVGSGDGLEAKEIRIRDVSARRADREAETEEDAVDRYILARVPPQPESDDDDLDQRDEDDERAVPDMAQIDLPDEMRRVLNLGNASPSKKDAPPEEIVRGVLTGSQAVSEKVRLQEIWGVGELEGAADDAEDDWDSDPEGWKGAVEM